MTEVATESVQTEKEFGPDTTNEEPKVVEETQSTEGVTNEGDNVEAATDEAETTETLDTYADFNFPEGVQPDQALLEKATPLFKELGLTQEQAQKLVDFQTGQVQAGLQNQVDVFDQLKQDWLSQTKQDAEIGGEKLDESVKTAQLALAKFGTPELTQLLNEMGLGNNPEMIRFMARVGGLTKEDNPGNGGSGVVKETKDRVSILYPS